MIGRPIIPSQQQVLSRRQLAWLAAALAHRDEDGCRLGPAELQLFVVYVLLCGEVGWCQLANRELAPRLATRVPGSYGAKHSAIRTARRKLKRCGLIACEKKPFDPPRRNPRTGALLVEPWLVEIRAPNDRGFRWPQAGEWITAVLGAGLRPIELKAALNLAAALDRSGQLCGVTRADLSAELGVQRDIALAALHRFGTLGLVSLREDHARRPARFAVTATARQAAGPQPIPKRLAGGVARGRLPAAVASATHTVEFVATSTVVSVADVEALRQQLWHPQLVEEAIAQASKHIKIGAHLQPRTLAEHFIQPVLELQQRYPASLVEQALTITIRQKQLPGEFRSGTWNHSWCKYAAAICKKKSASGRTRPALTPTARPAPRTAQPAPTGPDATASAPPAPQRPVKEVRITVESAQYNAAWINELRTICAAHPGQVPLQLVPPGGHELPLKTGPDGEQITVAPSAAFVAAIKALKARPAAVAA